MTTLFQPPTSVPPAYVSFWIDDSGLTPSASVRHFSVMLASPAVS